LKNDLANIHHLTGLSEFRFSRWLVIQGVKTDTRATENLPVHIPVDQPAGVKVASPTACLPGESSLTHTGRKCGDFPFCNCAKYPPPDFNSQNFYKPFYCFFSQISNHVIHDKNTHSSPQIFYPSPYCSI